MSQDRKVFLVSLKNLFFFVLIAESPETAESWVRERYGQEPSKAREFAAGAVLEVTDLPGYTTVKKLTAAEWVSATADQGLPVFLGSFERRLCKCCSKRQATEGDR